MAKNYYHDINNAIRTMHYKYGMGDLKEIRRYMDGKLELVCQGFGMKPHIRKGRIETDGIKTRIKIYGHQLTVNAY